MEKVNSFYLKENIFIRAKFTKEDNKPLQDIY